MEGEVWPLLLLGLGDGGHQAALQAIELLVLFGAEGLAIGAIDLGAFKAGVHQLGATAAG